MDGAKDFVKRFTTVPEVFVDELFSMVDENTLQTQAVLDLDVVVTWLKVPKEKLLKTLRNSYVEDTDFTIINAPNPNKQKSKYGSNNYKRVMLTSACFKELGMLSVWFNQISLWTLTLFALLPLAMTMALIWKTKEIILDSVFSTK